MSFLAKRHGLRGLEAQRRHGLLSRLMMRRVLLTSRLRLSICASGSLRSSSWRATARQRC